MNPVTEAEPAEKEKIAFERVTRVYRGQGKTPEEIEKLTKDHPGRPKVNATTPPTPQTKRAEISTVEQKAAAKAAAKVAANKPAGKPTPVARATEEEAGQSSATEGEDDAPPAITTLPPAMEGGWGEGEEK